MTMKNVVALSILMLLVSSLSEARVSSEVAKALGEELTAVGAQAQGNAAGTIPSYAGGLTQNSEADIYQNVFAKEKPLFIITAKNLAEYKENLSPGQLAMFAKYPESYTMPVYTSHRTASMPESIEAKAKKNAVTAELVDGGNGLKNFDEVLPFPIPASGLEVVWNHITRFRGGSVEINQAVIPVQSDGSFSPVVINAQLTPPQYLKGGGDKELDENILFYYTGTTKSPARLSGNILLIHETIDQVKEPRKAWIYNAGQRRIRRAPQVAYDAPGLDGLQTVDQTDMFSGAPDRYDWTLVGKKELYIPYNAYQMMDKDVEYDDIIAKNHIDQKNTRYELHRVWQVEATLIEGMRHIYSKRTLFLDEDSWQVAVADHYDNRGQLWRLSEGHMAQFVNADTPWYAAITSYDLFSGRYLISLTNEERNAFNFGKLLKRKHFTSASVRRSGKR